MEKSDSKEIGKREELGALARDWLAKSTSHSTVRFSGTRYHDSCTKMVWRVALVGAVAVCGWLLAGAILDYLQFDVVTRIRLYSERPALVKHNCTIVSSRIIFWISIKQN